jgi:AcrR family transcriptional regulator
MSSHTLPGVSPTDVRPQAARSRAAILEAAVRLIQTGGAAAVTHQRVAQEAGVGRATVYRHWPQQADLLTDALGRTHLRFLEPAEGTLVERVHADLRRVAKDLNTPELVAIAATVIERAQWDPEARALRDRLATHAVHNVEVAVREAVASGELAEAPPPDHLAAELLGPLWLQRFLLDARITDEFVNDVADAALDRWLAPAARRRLNAATLDRRDSGERPSSRP